MSLFHFFSNIFLILLLFSTFFYFRNFVTIQFKKEKGIGQDREDTEALRAGWKELYTKIYAKKKEERKKKPRNEDKFI